MIEWGTPFSLDFSPINIVISVVFISLAIFFIKRAIPQIDLALEAQLKSSLNRIFAGSNRQPLYSVFYNLHHSSTEAWVNWIKSQNEKKQERAFRRLSEYLAEAPKELGLITKEVVKATALFKHEESYEVLVNLLKKSREDWGKFKALTMFYEDAATYIVDLNAADAEAFLMKELKLAKNFKGSDELKLSIINALSKLPNVEKVAAVFAEIVLDTNQNDDIRINVLQRTEKFGETIYFDVIKTALKQILNKKAEVNDTKMFDYLIDELLEIARVDTGNNSIDDKWDLIIQASENEHYGKEALKLISEKISEKDFLLNPQAIFKLLQKTNCKKFSNLNLALERRYSISEEEKEIFSNADRMASLEELQANKDGEIFTIENFKNREISIPEFLTEQYKIVEDLINYKNSGSNHVKLLIGNAGEEKYFFTQVVASKSNKTLVKVDIPKLLLSPDKLTDFETIVHNHKPCILYLDNIQKLLEGNNNTESKRSEKVLNVIRKFFIDSRINIVATLNLDSIKLRDELPEIHEKISVIPNNDFSFKANLGALSAKQKQRIFNHFELKIKDEREIVIENIEDILNATEGYSNIAYLNFLLQYMKSSLLSHGKLIPIDLYQSLLKEANPKEVITV